jgi:hypothetical protein
LASWGVGDESRGYQIGKHFRIAKIGEVVIDFLGELATAGFEFLVEVENFGAEGFAAKGGIRGLRFERFNLGDWEWFCLEEPGQANTLQTLKDEIGRAVGAAHAGPDEADARSVPKVFDRIPFPAI